MVASVSITAVKQPRQVWRVDRRKYQVGKQSKLKTSPVATNHKKLSRSLRQNKALLGGTYVFSSR